MAPNTRRGERGFTLAGVIVIATIMLIVVAYTVPRMWSAILQRERERETVYVMKQYAIAIYNFQRKNNTYPVSMQQLLEARQPRFIRGIGGKEGTPDPLTGEVDWLVIPQMAAGVMPGNAGGGLGFGTGAGNGNAMGGGSTSTSTTGSTGTSGTSTSGSTGNPSLPGIPIKDYAGGPFVGIRPSKSGQAMLELNGQDHYEMWSYTSQDYEREMRARMNAYATVWK